MNGLDLRAFIDGLMLFAMRKHGLLFELYPSFSNQTSSDTFTQDSKHHALPKNGYTLPKWMSDSSKRDYKRIDHWLDDLANLNANHTFNQISAYVVTESTERLFLRSMPWIRVVF